MQGPTSIEPIRIMMGSYLEKKIKFSEKDLGVDKKRNQGISQTKTLSKSKTTFLMQALKIHDNP